MKNLLLLMSALFILTPSLGFADVREIVHMDQILSAIDPAHPNDTLVVFDLDNTVMEPVQTLGSDQWFKSNVKKEVDGGVNSDQAIDDNVPKFISVHQVTRMVPTEQETPKIIRMLQEKGVRVMALTARPVALVQRTLAELGSIGVDFTLQPIYSKNTAIGDSKTEAYVRGVALISPHGDKGLALITFLKQISQMPRNLIFVDDTPKNVVSVEAALNNTNYPYKHTSFRYGFDDAKVAQFNPQLADLQWKYFTTQHLLLTDAQAESILHGKQP